MPDRAIIPLVCGGSAGFLCGLVASVLEMSGSETVIMALVAGAVGAITGAISTLGVEAEQHERNTVMGLRAALAAAFAICLYFGMLTFLRDAQLLVAIILLLAGGFFAYCLTQIRVRTRLS